MTSNMRRKLDYEFTDINIKKQQNIKKLQKITEHICGP
jgi:hypothetical protein